MQVAGQAHPEVDISVCMGDFFVLWAVDSGNTISEPVA